MNLKLFLTLPALGIILLIFNSEISAQPKAGRENISKNDKIYSMAYDDTTRALAALFISKRIKIHHDQKTSIILLSASGAAFLVGGLMLSDDLSSSGTTSAANYAGYGIMLVGAFGIIVSATTTGINQLRLNPYTLRKYERVMKMYKNNEPIPEFYSKKVNLIMQKY